MISSFAYASRAVAHSLPRLCGPNPTMTAPPAHPSAGPPRDTLLASRDWLDHAPGCMAILRGPQHVFQWANADYRRLVGALDLIGRPASEAAPESRSQGFPALLDQVYETGTPYVARGMHVTLERAPGASPEDRWFDFTYAPVRAADGYVTGIVVHGHDVTQHIQAVEDLRRSEATLSAVLEALPVGVVIADAAGRILRDNAANRALWGVPPETTSWEQYADWVGFHPDTGRRIRAEEWAMSRALLKGETVRGELVECQPFDGGPRRFYLNNAAPVRDPDGRIVGGVVAELDVTEARAAQHTLEARTAELVVAQQRLEVALAAGGMGVWDWNVRTGESRWNEQLYALLRLPAPADGVARGERFIAMVHPDDRPRFDAAISRALADRGEFTDEFRVVHADGEVRWLVGRGKVICDAAGEPERMVGINFDVTERRANEQQLRELDVRRNEFLAMLGHELRNPLAPLANVVKLMERQVDAGEQQVVITQIVKRQVAQMSRLVDDLLEVSRVTQGRIELRKENVLLASPVLSGVEMVRPLLREQQQSLEIDVATDIDVVVDPARLTQIVANLLNNAAKYTPPGGRISVSAHAEADWVDLAVIDDGMGIDAQLLPRVFDLFAQGATTLDRSQGGLGIGLSLVKRLVELHGGSVRADSAGPGRGATFTVRLPRVERRRSTRGAAAGLPTKPLSPTAILVVEDNVDAADTLRMVLEADGHRVAVARDGPSAIDAARAFSPRLVLLDIGLPGMDGHAVARALRNEAAVPELAIVGLSGYGHAADHERGQAAGLDAYLVKPADLDQIYEAAVAALRRRARQD